MYDDIMCIFYTFIVRNAIGLLSSRSVCLSVFLPLSSCWRRPVHRRAHTDMYTDIYVYIRIIHVHAYIYIYIYCCLCTPDPKSINPEKKTMSTRQRNVVRRGRRYFSFFFSFFFVAVLWGLFYFFLILVWIYIFMCVCVCTNVKLVVALFAHMKQKDPEL
jgi:uncharacterized membrane protein